MRKGLVCFVGVLMLLLSGCSCPCVAAGVGLFAALAGLFGSALSGTDTSCCGYCGCGG